jgi:hypothetical protein
MTRILANIKRPRAWVAAPRWQSNIDRGLALLVFSTIAYELNTQCDSSCMPTRHGCILATYNNDPVLKNCKAGLKVDHVNA